MTEIFVGMISFSKSNACLTFNIMIDDKFSQRIIPFKTSSFHTDEIQWFSLFIVSFVEKTMVEGQQKIGKKKKENKEKWNVIKIFFSHNWFSFGKYPIVQ